jgi:four helix bundle protein
VAVRRFEDLVAWQLAHRLQNEVFAFTARPQCARDISFCDQIRSSSRSATANIAEGFGRYYPKEMIRYLRIAAASLHETKNHLRDANDRGYLSDAAHETLVRLTLRSLKATTRLIGYLQHAKAPEPFARTASREPKDLGEPGDADEPNEP